LAAWLVGVVGGEMLAAQEKPPAQPAELETVRLVGFRELDPDLLLYQVSADPLEAKAGMPIQLFLQAARNSNQVREAIAKAGKNEESAQLEDWFKAAQSVASSRQWQELEAGEPRTASRIPFKLSGAGQTVYADGDFLIGLTASELFAARGTPAGQSVQVAQIPDSYGNQIASILLAAPAANAVKSAYGFLNPELVASDPHWPSGAIHCANNINVNPVVSNRAKIRFCDVSFGRPQLFSASQKQLKVPSGLGEKGLVFWLDLFVTLQNLQPKDFEYLTLQVNMAPATAISLALIPEFQRELGVLEAISAEVREMLMKHVAARYKALKPSIAAGGLRESTISWKMSSDALSESSYMFSAIIHVPQEIQAIDLILSLEGRTQKKFLVRSDIVVTEQPIKVRIPLRFEDGK
jgi:hypothetical protein